MIKRVRIRSVPTPDDIDRLMAAGRAAVDEIAAKNGAIGKEAIERFYAERLYAAVVAGAEPKRNQQ